MSEIVKLKIRLGNQELEYEGPAETFSEVYAEFMGRVEDSTSSTRNPQEEIYSSTKSDQSTTGTETMQNRKNGRSTRGKRSYPNPPMDTSLNLHANTERQGLREFFEEKRPQGKFEANAVFGYYLENILGISNFNEAQIRACYQHANLPAPSYFRQSLIDTKNKAGYVEMAANGWKLSISGENFVKFDLPRSKKEAE